MSSEADGVVATNIASRPALLFARRIIAQVILSSNPAYGMPCLAPARSPNGRFTFASGTVFSVQLPASSGIAPLRQIHPGIAPFFSASIRGCRLQMHFSAYAAERVSFRHVADDITRQREVSGG